MQSQFNQKFYQYNYRETIITFEVDLFYYYYYYYYCRYRKKGEDEDLDDDDDEDEDREEGEITGENIAPEGEEKGETATDNDDGTTIEPV